MLAPAGPPGGRLPSPAACPGPRRAPAESVFDAAWRGPGAARGGSRHAKVPEGSQAGEEDMYVGRGDKRAEPPPWWGRFGDISQSLLLVRRIFDLGVLMQEEGGQNGIQHLACLLQSRSCLRK
ncbi:unnamed protein product [Prorocentrum cordatum]|uniref:Uncharacterized protein n=1 Tax=Prorocentrum cordatum TaxID=2364126 RepID=A0ABN9SC32_9DINO|nr:unnamed protein product [Polarella glacialis]